MNLFTVLLKRLHIRHTAAYSTKLYEEHPYRNTLYGLSSLLSKYHVTNQGLRITDKSSISKLPCPCIAQFSNDFVLVTKISSTHVEYEWNENHLSSSLDEFKERWSGVILAILPDSESVEPDYEEHRQKAWLNRGKHLLLLAACMAIIAIAIWQNHEQLAMWRLPLLALYLAGAYVSYLLLLHQLHVSNKTAQKMCSLLKKNSCTDVLDTPAARLFGVVSWSEIGFGYFIAGALSMLVIPNSIHLQMMLAGCAIPFTFWSVWYQWKRAHQWCTLCLVVQSILLVQAIVFCVANTLVSQDCSWPAALSSLCLLPISVVGTNLIVALLEQQKEAKHWKYSYRRIKANTHIYEALQQEQPSHPDDSTATTIGFGKKDSKHVVTVFSNPYCNPCARLHPHVHALLDAGIRVQYIFSAFNEELLETNRYLIAAYQQLGEKKALQIFDAWYKAENKDQDSFFKAFNLDISTEDVQNELDRHSKWKETEGLHATPTILIDGKEMNEIYVIEDFEEIL